MARKINPPSVDSVDAFDQATIEHSEAATATVAVQKVIRAERNLIATMKRADVERDLALLAAPGRTLTPADIDRQLALKARLHHFTDRAGVRAKYAKAAGKKTAETANAHAIKPAKPESESEDSSGLPSWARGWYFSIAEEGFIKPGQRLHKSDRSFQSAFGKKHFGLPKDEKFGTQSAMSYVQKVAGFAGEVEATVRVMGRPELFEWDGKTFFNTFDPRSVPLTAKEYTDDGLAAVLTIQYHLRRLLGPKTGAVIMPRWVDGAWVDDHPQNEQARMLESYIALNVREPGRPVGICPLIKGEEGDGKTIVGQGLMGALLGKENVGQIVNSEVVAENDVTWAVGHAFKCIEELRPVDGKDRRAVVEKLKTYVTNESVSVYGKWVKRHTEMNATNYIGLTNHADALPLGKIDRRWLPLFTPWSSIGEFMALEGRGDNPTDALRGYFERVGGAFEHAGELRKYFAELQLFAGFYHGMRAPETDAKRTMIELERDNSNMSTVSFYLKEGAYGVSDQIVSTKHLNDVVAYDTGGSRPMTININRELIASGYSKVPFKMKWDGVSVYVYVKDPALAIEPKDDVGAVRVRKQLHELLNATNAKKGASFDDLSPKQEYEQKTRR